MSQESQREGNTRNRARRFIFTLNNYTTEECLKISNFLVDKKYIYGFEKGIEGTPHLQGYFEAKNQIDFNVLKNLNPRVHWEKAKGDQKSNLKYCSKELNYRTNMKIPEPIKILENLRPWQKEIEDLILTKPDERTVYWYYDTKGGCGKTSLIKYLCVKYDFIQYSCASKSADILTIANEDKSCYLLNFTRSQEGFCPYNALEQLKDGLVSDSKLKKVSNQIIMNCPHVICFANWLPDVTLLSMDRWRLIEL